MTDPIAFPRNAAEWFLAVHAVQDPSAETLQAWLRWLESSEDNRRAFDDIVQIWHRTASAVISRAPSRVLEEDYDGSIPVAQWRARQKPRSPGEGFVQRWRRRYRVLAVAAVAALAVICVVSFRAVVPPPISKGAFVTGTGEHRQLNLADGSLVTLGADTKLSVALQPARREIRLDAGEAYFSVAKDSRWPFVVRALNGEITAVGTAFNVKALDGRVVVTVTEGKVKVADAPPSHAPLPSKREQLVVSQLSKGEQLIYAERESAAVMAATTIRHIGPDESPRWREGWLVYRDEPLKYVIADISRYTTLRVEVAASAAELQFSGAVFKDDVDEWIAALAEVASVTVERAGDAFVIRARSATPASRSNQVTNNQR